jgi:hypothetical protein
VDAALAGLAVLATAVTVAPALARFFAALRPDFPHSPGSSGPGPLDLLPQIRKRDAQQVQSVLRSYWSPAQASTFYAGRSDVPDEVFLVSTIRPNPWWVTCLRREGKNYYDDGERFHELDPTTLTQLTKR